MTESWTDGRRRSWDRVGVGPFQVEDLPRDELVRQVVRAWAESTRASPMSVFALHVGGLNNRGDRGFVDTMNAADFVYADGGSVVGLAKLSGAKVIERAPTTDIGWELLRALGTRIERPPRLALIGGEPLLAERAADVLAEHGAGVPVLAEHGYHSDWGDVIARARAAEPDVCIVGMGAPLEMLWVRDWFHALPPSIVMTSGGWFGHMVGDERRAPRILRRAGLEWIARTAQAPRRLGPRYARGAWSSAVIAVALARQRGT